MLKITLMFIQEKHLFLVTPLYIFLTSLFYVGCQTAPTPRHDLKNAEQITWVGHNSSPQYSPDGKLLLYVSSRRESHETHQIYIMDENQESEKRLTSNKGENFSPVFHSQQPLYFYTSNTDNNKNMRELLKKYMNTSSKAPPESKIIKNFPARDIYSSHLDGQNILRRTKNKSFNDFLKIHPRGHSLLLSKQVNTYVHLHTFHFLSKKLQQITRGPHFNLEPSYSPNGQQIAWVRFLPKEVYSQIFITENKKQRSLKLPKGIYHTPIWTNDNASLIFSAQLSENESEKIKKQLYIFNLKSNCLQKIRHYQGNSYQPSINHTGQHITFVNDHSGAPQIYRISLSIPHGKCF